MRTHLCLGGLLTLGALACRAPTPAPAPTEAPRSSAPAEPVAPPRMPDPPPTVTAAVQMLPAGALAAFQASSGRRVFEVLQRDAFDDAFPDGFDKIARESRSEFGTDLTVLDGWQQLGVDPQGPVGFAVLSIQDEAVCAWVTAADMVKLRRTLFDLTGRFGTKLRSTATGAAEVLRTDAGLSFVLRDRFVFMVLTERGSTTDYARALAFAKPRSALAAVVGDFTGADLRGHLNLKALAQDLADEQRGEAERFPARRERVERETTALQFLLRGLPRVDVRADATATGVVAKATATVAAGEFPLALLSGPATPSPLLPAMNGRLMMFGSGQLDVSAAAAAADAVGPALGGSWTEFVTEAKAFGFDLNAQLLPLLDGRASAALTLRATTPLRDVNIKHAFDFAIAFGLRDAAKMTTFLDRVAAALAKIGVRVAVDAKTGMRSVRRGGRDVVLGVVGEHFIVTTDRGLPGRLRSNRPGTLERESSPQASLAQIAAGQPSLLFAHDFTPWLWADAHSPGFRSRPFAPPTGRTRGEKRQIRRLVARLTRVNEKLDALAEQRDLAELNSLFAVADALGMQVYTLTTNGQDLVLDGTHTLRAKAWAEVIGRLGEAAREHRRLSQLPERQRLRDERRTLDDELRSLGAGG